VLPELIDRHTTAGDAWADTAYRSKADGRFLAGRLLRSFDHLAELVEQKAAALEPAKREKPFAALAPARSPSPPAHRLPRRRSKPGPRLPPGS
jgi:hypothetical protein